MEAAFIFDFLPHSIRLIAFFLVARFAYEFKPVLGVVRASLDELHAFAPVDEVLLIHTVLRERAFCFYFLLLTMLGRVTSAYPYELGPPWILICLSRRSYIHLRRLVLSSNGSTHGSLGPISPKPILPLLFQVEHFLLGFGFFLVLLAVYALDECCRVWEANKTFISCIKHSRHASHIHFSLIFEISMVVFS